MNDDDDQPKAFSFCKLSLIGFRFDVAVELMSVFIYNHLSLPFVLPSEYRIPHNEPLNTKFCYYINFIIYFLWPCFEKTLLSKLMLFQKHRKTVEL